MQRDCDPKLAAQHREALLQPPAAVSLIGYRFFELFQLEKTGMSLV